jgi:Group II intron, maturase-specific domain
MRWRSPSRRSVGLPTVSDCRTRRSLTGQLQPVRHEVACRSCSHFNGGNHPCHRMTISPVAANMTLDGLEAVLAERFQTATWTGLKMNMVRFIIIGTSKEWLEQKVKPAVVQFLAERGLVLSPEKTKITHIRDGFDFLGWNIRKYRGKLLMKPSKANVKAHLDKIREVIKANKTAKQANLIRLLNPVVLGWANYHSHVTSESRLTTRWRSPSKLRCSPARLVATEPDGRRPATTGRSASPSKTAASRRTH